MHFWIKETSLCAVISLATIVASSLIILTLLTILGMQSAFICLVAPLATPVATWNMDQTNQISTHQGIFFLFIYSLGGKELPKLAHCFV